MAALGPPPPPYSSGRQISEGHSRSNSMQAFSSIYDLRARAKREVTQTKHTSTNALLNEATNSTVLVGSEFAYRKPQTMYVEWLKCEEHLELLGQHSDYPFMSPEARDILKSIKRKHEDQRKSVVEVEDMLSSANIRDNTIPNGLARNGVGPYPGSINSTRTTRANSQEAELHMNGHPSTASSIPSTYSNTREAPSWETVYVMPPSQVPSRGTSLNQDDPLLSRFSQLRIAQNGEVANKSDAREKSHGRVGPPATFQHHTNGAFIGATELEEKPAGPRAMPGKYLQPTTPPRRPDKRPVESFPRAPSPIYNPGQAVQSPHMTPPRTSSKAYVETRRVPVPSRKPFVELSTPHMISAEELFDRTKESRILLIDVREREQFDEGHIHAKHIICIEPIVLRHGLPVEGLEDKLIYSPEPEIQMFSNLREYDLVVYYDNGTKSDSFLRGSPKQDVSPYMRALHDTLTEFNYVKGLQRQPAFLVGGLNAWVDLVSIHSLQTSDTALSRTSKLPKPVRRQPNRASLVSGNSSREIRSRRLREYDPLNADEERQWREKARSERVEPSDFQQLEREAEKAGAGSQDDELFLPVQTYDEFFRRYPDHTAIQRESMISPPQQFPPSRLPPPPPLPTIPSRPPPTMSRPSYSGVSDRVTPQAAQAAQQLPTSRPPIYTSRSVIQALKLPRTGMKNFGVTCYMNATIQCLQATMPLSRFLLDETWRGYVQKNWKGSNGVMPEIVANLVRTLWRQDAQSVRPTTLRSFCARLNPEWGIDRQQDAKEFFDFIVDCLHEDLNENFDRTPLNQLTTAEEMTREQMQMRRVSRKEWERYSHRERSFISSLFAGQHASRLRCTTCRNTSTTYEAFYSISVEIPQRGTGDVRDCLRSYCQEERLSGEEEWKCPHCRCQREATKQIIITRLPTILVVHFKRFSASKTESARKVHTPIDFPLHGLDMAPYMGATRMETRSDELPDPAITPPFSYDCYAVLRHIGQTGNGGHYISLCRDAARRCWRKYDDTNVSDFDPGKLKSGDKLQNNQAYIVFYERAIPR